MSLTRKYAVYFVSGFATLIALVGVLVAASHDMTVVTWLFILAHCVSFGVMMHVGADIYFSRKR